MLHCITGWSQKTLQIVYCFVVVCVSLWKSFILFFFFRFLASFLSEEFSNEMEFRSNWLSANYWNNYAHIYKLINCFCSFCISNCFFFYLLYRLISFLFELSLIKIGYGHINRSVQISSYFICFFFFCYFLKRWQIL